MVMLKDGERLDRTGFGEIVVIQRKGLGYGVDAVLLAAFAAGETGALPIDTRASGASVADLGAGNGVISFILAHKLKDVRLTGFEVREDAYDRAVRACEINGLTEKIEFVKDDILNAVTLENEGSFDAVVSNPPYFKKGAAIPSSGDDKFIARHETTALLADFTETASRLLKSGGSLYMVHRPSRLAEIFEAMKQAGIEPKELQMVAPRAGEAANIVLVHGIKGAGPDLSILPEIAVHTEGEGYSELVEKIYEKRYN